MSNINIRFTCITKGFKLLTKILYISLSVLSSFEFLLNMNNNIFAKLIGIIVAPDGVVVYFSKPGIQNGIKMVVKFVTSSAFFKVSYVFHISVNRNLYTGGNRNILIEHALLENTGLIVRP